MERHPNKKLYVKMTVNLSFEEFQEIADNPYLHTGFNEVKKCATENCEGWFATVNGKPSGEECWEGCGNYFCENCIDLYMDDIDNRYSKKCKQCKTV